MEIKYLYKFRNINKHTLNLLINNEFYFSSPTDFNDPFDCRSKVIYQGTRDEWIIWCNKNNLSSDESNILADYWYDKKFNNFQIDSYLQKEEIKDIRILTLSESSDNILIWSHYSESHNGICLEFKTTICENSICLKFEKNQFKYPTKILPENLLPALKVLYSEKYPEVYNRLKDDSKKLTAFLLTKHKLWEYEKERRIILFDKWINNNLIKFDKEILSGIIFGLQTNINDIKLIISILEKYYFYQGYKIKLYKSVPKFDYYGIDILEITNIDEFITEKEDIKTSSLLSPIHGLKHNKI